MADNPIDIKKIFDFDDTTPLDQVIAKTQQLNTVLDAMLQSAQKTAAGYTASMQAIQKSVDALEQEITQADVATKKGQDTINNGAQVTAQAVQQNEAYKKSLTSLTDQIKMLQDQIDKLNQSSKDKGPGSDAQLGSLKDLKDKLKDATDAYTKMGAAVDSSVKADALKRITDLNAQVQAGQKIVTDAKKATDLAAGSYNDLAVKVANATKQLKSMEGGIGSTSQQFKDLQKFVTDGNNKLKEFDLVLGNAQREVGGYKKAIEEALPALSKISPTAIESTESLKKMGAQLLTLITNPVVLGIAAIVAAFELLRKSVNLYTEGTIEGADRAKEFSAQWTTALEIVQSKMKSLGKATFDYITDSKNLDKILFSFSPLLLVFEKWIQSQGDYQKRLKANTEIIEMQNELRKEEMILIEEGAELELEKQKELFTVREKESNSLQQRYDALVKANVARREEAQLKIQDAQLEVNIQEAYFKKLGIANVAELKIKDLLQNETVLQKKSYDQVKELAEARAKLTDAKKSEFEGTRRIQASEVELIKEQIDVIREAAKQEQTTRDELNVAIIESNKQANNRIISNQSSSLEEKLEAFKNNGELEEQLIGKKEADELRALRLSAQDKIHLDKDTSDQIRKQAGDDIKLRAELILNAKNKILDSDNQFALQEQRIEQANDTAILELRKKNARDLVQLTIDTKVKELQAQGNQTSTGNNKAIEALNDQFRFGLISLKNYNIQKAKLELEAKNDTLQNEIEILQEKKFAFKQDEELEKRHAQDIIEIDKQVSEKKKQISENQIAFQKQIAAQTHTLTIQLEQQIVTSVGQIVDNGFQYQIDSYNKYLSDLSERHDTELALAGDNAQAKAAIEKQYAAQQKKAQDQIAKEQRRKAIFDKEVAAGQILVKTAQAIAEQLPGLPLTAPIIELITAIGAAEEAVVLSQKIPAYFKGTHYSEEGWATVAEKGAEIGIERSGKLEIYDKPQLRYLKEGTKILPNEVSDPILKKMDTKHMDLISHQLVDIGIREFQSTKAMNQEVVQRLSAIDDSVKKNKPKEVNYAKVGAMVYMTIKEREDYAKRQRALSMGAWLDK